MFFLLVIRPYDLRFGLDFFQHRESKMTLESFANLKDNTLETLLSRLVQASRRGQIPDLLFHSTKNKGPTGVKPIGPMNYDSNLLPEEIQAD